MVRTTERIMQPIFSTMAVALTVLAPVTAAAQQPATGRPAVPSAQRPPAVSPTAPQNTGVIADGKVAIIDTEAFADPKTGIIRLVSVLEALNREFKPRSDELQKSRAQYEQLGKDIEATRSLEDQRARSAKIEQAEALKKDIERKTQDAQSAYQKRLREVTEPIYKDISPALQAFARQRGVNVIFDVSKLGEVMFIINDSVDLTRPFITEYNQRNPVTTAPARQ
ncbi:MAG: OmpH family outer membrane protein [Acidobacteriota bacterium]|nr:OmpH family outer membrane protein [Acidobacteriota bacterium]